MTKNLELDNFSRIRVDLVVGSNLPDEVGRIEAGKKAARDITTALRSDEAKGLPMEVLAKRFGLDAYVERTRGGVRLDLSAAVADVLRIPKGAIPTIERPQDITEAVTRRVREVFVPTTKKPRRIGTGNGVFEEKATLPRLELIVEVLEVMDVDMKTVDIWEGMVTDEMMRGLPYYCFVVPSLNRMILVCEEEGNMTFVVNQGQNPEKFYAMSKDELKVHDAVGFFKWNANTVVWQEKMMTHLSSDTPIKEQRDTGELASVKPTDVVEFDGDKMDKAYFENAENIKYDLEAYAAALGEDKSPLDLATSNLRKLSIRCKNGELVNGITYVLRAGVMIGLADSYKEAQSIGRNILDKLFEIVGYKPMNEKYFEDADNVKKDLEAYAAALGKDKSPLDIKFVDLKGLSVKCQSGQIVKGNVYLHRAAAALKLVESADEAKLEALAILDTLLEMAGYELMNKKYFKNVENVKKDLEAYAQSLGPDKSPLDLSMSNLSNLSVKCSNGQTVAGGVYLSLAGRKLDLVESAKEASLLDSGVLDTLLKMAGYEQMNKRYFENGENVKKDLEAYAQSLGPDKSPLDLSLNNLQGLYVKCCNGQTVAGGVYIALAGQGLGLVQSASEARLKDGRVIESLLEIAGYQQMNEKYFADADNVKKDLEAYAEALGKDKSPLDLNTKTLAGISVKCQNGETLSGTAYVARAGVAFGLARNLREARSVGSSIIKRLLEIAG